MLFYNRKDNIVSGKIVYFQINIKFNHLPIVWAHEIMLTDYNLMMSIHTNFTSVYIKNPQPKLTLI